MIVAALSESREKGKKWCEKERVAAGVSDPTALQPEQVCFWRLTSVHLTLKVQPDIMC